MNFLSDATYKAKRKVSSDEIDREELRGLLNLLKEGTIRSLLIQEVSEGSNAHHSYSYNAVISVLRW